MENYMKFEMIGKGGGGNCVFLVKSLLDNKVFYSLYITSYRHMQ